MIAIQSIIEHHRMVDLQEGLRCDRKIGGAGSY